MKFKDWDIPKEVEVFLFLGAIFLAPYLIIRAALEERKLRRQGHGS